MTRLLTITAELKETHLAPSFNPFSRSSSTSTLAPAESHVAEVNAPASIAETRSSVGSWTADLDV